MFHVNLTRNNSRSIRMYVLKEHSDNFLDRVTLSYYYYIISYVYTNQLIFLKKHAK